MLTNEQGLPKQIVNAIEFWRSRYDAGDSDITVTSLISPPRLVALKREHQREIVEDAADLIYSTFGSVMHYLLQMAGDDGIIEERLFTECQGWKVSGQVDWAKNGHICDWKVMSVWEAINGIKEEKVQQLNLLAELMRRNGHAVEGLWIGSIYRDWSKSKAREDGYPDHQMQMHYVELWPSEQASAFLDERVRLHQAARESLPLCTAEERWGVPNKWAVMKKGRKRAVKLFETERAAHDWIQEQDDADDLGVEFRRGESKRCRLYCPVSTWCVQFNEGVKNQ